MKQEMQHWLSRNRPPRVQITYDVEMLGATVKEEIPFIAGIMGDFAGATTQPALAERSFVEIDRDNFVDVMGRLKPTVTLGSKPKYQVSRAPDGNTYTPDTDNFPVQLTFQKMEDFAPPALIAQVPALKSLLDTRQSLTDLMAKLGTDPSLEKQLIAAASGSTMAPAAAALTRAQGALVTATAAPPAGTTPAKGAVDLFTAAVTAASTAETDPAKQTAVKNLLTPVTAAMTDPKAGFTAAFTAATGATASAADVTAAGAALQAVLAALQGGIAGLATFIAAYPTPPSAEQVTAAGAFKDASAGVDALVPLAWNTSLYVGSLQVAPPVPTPTPTS